MTSGWQIHQTLMMMDIDKLWLNKLPIRLLQMPGDPHPTWPQQHPLYTSLHGPQQQLGLLTYQTHNHVHCPVLRSGTIRNTCRFLFWNVSDSQEASEAENLVGTARTPLYIIYTHHTVRSPSEKPDGGKTIFSISSLTLFLPLITSSLNSSLIQLFLL